MRPTTVLWLVVGVLLLPAGGSPLRAGQERPAEESRWVARFGFNGGIDSAGTPVAATTGGGAVFVEGLEGEALRLRAADAGALASFDRADLPFGRGDDFSVQFWVRTTTVADRRMALLSSKVLADNSLAAQKQAGWVFSMSGGTWAWNMGSTDRRITYERDNGAHMPLNDGRWHQLAMTYDAARAEVRLYYDGRNRAVYNVRDAVGFDFTSAAPLVVGWAGAEPRPQADIVPAIPEGAAKLQQLVDEFARLTAPWALEGLAPEELVRLIAEPEALFDDKLQRAAGRPGADREALLAAAQSVDFAAVSAIESELMDNPYTIHQVVNFMETAPAMKIYSLVDGRVTIDDDAARAFTEGERLYPSDFDIDELEIWDRPLAPEEVLDAYAANFVPVVDAVERRRTSLTAGAWNIFHGGKHFTVEEHGWDSRLAIAQIIERENIDVLMMQETYSAGDFIAAELGYYFATTVDWDYLNQGSNISVLSRFPITELYVEPDSPFMNVAAKVAVSATQDIYVMSNWYGMQQFQSVFDFHRERFAASDTVPTLFGGDFNAVPHTDGGDSPASPALLGAGFADAFRSLHPDVRASPGPTHRNGRRIDQLYYKGAGLRNTSTHLVDAWPTGFPSDHKLIVARFDLDSAAARQQPGTGPEQAAAVEPTDAATRMRAWEQHQRMEAESPFADLEWRAVGPRMQGGRIESIDVPAGSDSTIYLGVGSGNLWKTTNNGTTWRPIFEKESAFAIGDVTIAPSNPEIVWVGTGEVLMARSSYAGTGVFKSTDAGETWRNMGLTDSHHIARVLIHPDDPDTVWVAAIGHLYSENPERGVYRTVDGGVTWERVLYVDERTGAIELVADPADPDTLYAAMWERSRKAWGHTTNGPGSGVYKSTDGGTTWQQLGDGMGGGAGLPVGDHIGRIGLAVAPSNPAVVYALVDNYAPDPSPPADQDDRGPRRIGGEIYRSDDLGETWRKVNEEPIPAGYDFCLIRVAPDDENIVYLPNNRFWVSEDGGRTTRQIEGTLVHLLPHGSRVLHLDMHDLWIDPDDGDHMLLGNDGGLHLSYDRGASWLHLNNLPIGEFYAVSVDMDEPYNIYGGTQDDAALFGASDQVIEDDLGDRWSHVYLDRWGGGDSYFTYRDELDPDLIYYEHQFGDLRRKRMSTGETVRIRPEAGEGEPALRRNWMTPFFISQHDPLTLYYGAHALFKSLDRGDNWLPVSPDLTSRPNAQGNVPWGTLTSVAESPLRPGLLYTGADDGTMHVTRDDGATWTRIGEDLPERWVTRMAASRHREGTVYATLTGYRYDDFAAYVFVSEDDGATWRSIVGNLPAEPVNVVAEDPVSADILYLGTDTGVYASIDRGATWHALCADLPTTPVYDLVIHPRDGELVIGTHGRSIFVLDVTPVRMANRRR